MVVIKTCACPEINDQDWHLQDTDWSGKFFYFDYLRHFLKIPLNYAKKCQEMKSEIVRKGYQIIQPDLVLRLPGLFQGRILTEIEEPEQYDANVEKFENARILTRVYKGSPGGLKVALEELKAFVQDRTHVLPSAVYYWHVTCPICSPKRGWKTVLFARV